MKRPEAGPETSMAALSAVSTDGEDLGRAKTRIGSMCTGYGGLDLAARAVYGGELGWCADNDPHASVLLARRFAQVSNLGDLTTVDWTRVPAVDIVTAGF